MPCQPFVQSRPHAASARGSIALPSRWAAQYTRVAQCESNDQEKADRSPPAGRQPRATVYDCVVLEHVFLSHPHHTVCTLPRAPTHLYTLSTLPHTQYPHVA